MSKLLSTRSAQNVTWMNTQEKRFKVISTGSLSGMTERVTLVPNLAKERRLSAYRVLAHKKYGYICLTLDHRNWPAAWNVSKFPGTWQFCKLVNFQGLFNTLGPNKTAAILQAVFSNLVFFYENSSILVTFSLKFILKSIWIHNRSALLQMMSGPRLNIRKDVFP